MEIATWHECAFDRELDMIGKSANPWLERDLEGVSGDHHRTLDSGKGS